MCVLLSKASLSLISRLCRSPPVLTGIAADCEQLGFLLDLGRTLGLALDPLRTRRTCACRFARRAVAFSLAVGSGVTRRAVPFHPAVGAGVAAHALMFPLAVRAPFARYAVLFQLAVGSRCANRAGEFQVAMGAICFSRASLSSHHSRSAPSLPHLRAPRRAPPAKRRREKLVAFLLDATIIGRDNLKQLVLH